MSIHKMVAAQIFLPEYYNIGSAGRRLKIEERKYKETAEELTTIFGGGTWYKDRKGSWLGKTGKIHEDRIRVFEIDMIDSIRNKRRIKNYITEILVARFDQEAIYLRFVEVESYTLYKGG